VEDKNKEVAEKATVSPSTKEAPMLQASQSRTGGGSTVLAWLAILLSVGALALAGWMYQNSLKDNGLQRGLAELKNATAGNAKSLQQLSQSVAATHAALQAEAAQGLVMLGQQTDQRLASLESAGQAQRQQLLEMRSVDRSDWILAEAEYLLRLAHQRLLMAGDLRSALSILNNVDGILRELDDPELYPVRAAIAADAAKLRAVPAIDIEGVWLRIQALASQVDKLVLFELPEAVSEIDQPLPSADWRQRLQQGFDAALARLSSYIVIRRREQAYQPLIEPQWEGLVRQNLHMLLAQSQSALLSGNVELYQQSLATARRWLAEFFAFSETSVAVLDDQLQQLQQEQVAREYPDISGSLLALKTALAVRHETGEGN